MEARAAAKARRVLDLAERVPAPALSVQPRATPVTRVCVTWDREETARLVTRCREKLAAREFDSLIKVVDVAGVLNRALTAVLDGIAATLGGTYQSRERDVENALTSLAAIAEALGVQEEGR